MFDHLGFGFSDKPKDYSYSLMEQAEQVKYFHLTLDLSLHVGTGLVDQAWNRESSCGEP